MNSKACGLYHLAAAPSQRAAHVAEVHQLSAGARPQLTRPLVPLKHCKWTSSSILPEAHWYYLLVVLAWSSI